MAAKGTYAKEEVFNKIQEIFKEDFVGIFDKKAYVWAQDGTEKVQVCISLTCPKVPMGELAQYVQDNKLNFEDTLEVKQESTPEISKEEKDNIQALMERLGL